MNNCFALNITMLLFRATDGGETPLLCVIIILIQSTNLHTSPVWSGAWLKIIKFKEQLNAELTTGHTEHAAILLIVIYLFRACVAWRNNRMQN